MGGEGKTKNAPMMRCYYEVLGIERDATAEEIKTAYKRAALKWHPDKNAHQADLAHNMFQEITQAYSTLSVPNERAWYDSHRDSILRGGDGTADEEAEGINLWPFFSSSCYQGYTDGPNGFYAVYGRLFEALDEAEAKVVENTKKGKERSAAPLFGTSTTPYTEVKKFYNYWQSFMTIKTFSWCDQYNTTQADSRRVRRLMEQDNKKARDKAKKAYNEQIRHLAEYVKKRDKRITEFLAKQQREREEINKINEEKKKKENEEKAQRLQQLKEEREREWAQQMAEMEEGSDEALLFAAQEEDTRGKKSEIYCAPCKKVFKSEKQWISHERSKKHLQAVEAFADQLLEHDLANGDGGEEEGDEAVEGEGEEGETVEGEEGEELEGEGEGEEGEAFEGEEGEEFEGEGEGEGEEGEEGEEEEGEEAEEVEGEEVEGEEGNEGEEVEGEERNEGEVGEVEGEGESVSEVAVEETAQETEKEEAAVDNEEEEPKKGQQQNGKKQSKQKGKQAAASKDEQEGEGGEEEDEEAGDEEESNSKGKRGGKQPKVRRRRRAEKEDRGKSKGFPCGVCGTSFGSRNKLFVHIKDKNHAQPLGETKKRTRKGDRDD